MDETRQFLFETNFQRTKLIENVNITIYLQDGHLQLNLPTKLKECGELLRSN